MDPSHQLSHLPHIRPIGIFWDIENLNVPFNRSVFKLVEKIRRYVFTKSFRESEFLVVCDTHKTNKDLLDDLNSSQVTVVHISSIAKNAADDKLKQQIIRFIEANGYQSAILVLTDDINFACVLSDLKNRGHVEIMLVQRQASPALKNCADVVLNYEIFTQDLPLRSINNNNMKESKVLVQNLPKDRKIGEMKKRLLQLSANCGGKKIEFDLHRNEATIRFICLSDAKRAQQRIHRQDVFDNKIMATVLDETKECSATDSSDNSESSNDVGVSDSSNDDTAIPSSILKNFDFELLTKYRNLSNSDPELNQSHSLCFVHTSCGPKQWPYSDGQLPLVHISIPNLSSRVHHLLDTHRGVLSLNSFVECYINEFNELFDITTNPVISLEHLITCVPGVCITTAPSICQKQITWIPCHHRHLLDDSIKSEPITTSRNAHNYSQQISQFGKEVRELLKSQPNTIIPFHKFVPTYHSHFVRQLCVTHYGVSKLWNLLEEIPHIVQVYGEHDQRMITLTHREQTKRFEADLIKILNTQFGRCLKLSQFSATYQLVFKRPFDVSDYGVCYFDDIFRDVCKGPLIVRPFGTGDQMIEMPKRERTSDHKMRTLFFAKEVVKMMSDSKEVIDFSITFSQFIPCYQRYYTKQCRVIDYGFRKLIELFEELSPKIIEIHSSDWFGEKYLQLSHEFRLKALIQRFESLLKTLPTHSLLLSDFELEYEKKFKSKIDYNDYYVIDLIDLVDIMSTNRFRIIQTNSYTKIELMNKNCVKNLRQF